MPLIHEAIITSLDTQDKPHIAPFGVRQLDDQVLIAPFRPSASLDNLLLHRCAVMNLTDDVRVFAGALTGRRDWPLRPADKVHGAVLESALAHRELELHMLPVEKIDAEMAYLSIAIEKTAGEREIQAWQWLVERVDNFKAETNMGNMA